MSEESSVPEKVENSGDAQIIDTIFHESVDAGNRPVRLLLSPPAAHTAGPSPSNACVAINVVSSSEQNSSHQHCEESKGSGMVLLANANPRIHIHRVWIVDDESAVIQNSCEKLGMATKVFGQPSLSSLTKTERFIDLLSQATPSLLLIRLFSSCTISGDRRLRQRAWNYLHIIQTQLRLSGHFVIFQNANCDVWTWKPMQELCLLSHCIIMKFVLVSCSHVSRFQPDHLRYIVLFPVFPLSIHCHRVDANRTTNFMAVSNVKPKC